MKKLLRVPGLLFSSNKLEGPERGGFIQIKLLFFTISVLFWTLPVGAFENRLHPFTTDGCSMAPDRDYILGTRDWVGCCVQHDQQYWRGGSVKEKADADLGFKQCLVAQGMSEFEADFFYNAVQIGGHPDLRTSWRWGYGWEFNRGFAPVGEAEMEQIKPFLPLFDLPFQIITRSSLTSGTDYCKSSAVEYVQELTGHLLFQEYEVYHIKSKIRTEAYQVYMKSCPGAYFYVDLGSSLSPDRCLLKNQFTKKPPKTYIHLIGQCEDL